MKNEMHKPDLNRRQQRKRRRLLPLLSLLTPVQLFLSILLSCVTGEAPAQCYTDPYTGQRIYMRPFGNSPPPAGPSRQVVAESPTANDNTTNINSAAHCRIAVNDNTLG